MHASQWLGFNYTWKVVIAIIKKNKFCERVYNTFKKIQISIYFLIHHMHNLFAQQISNVTIKPKSLFNERTISKLASGFWCLSNWVSSLRMKLIKVPLIINYIMWKETEKEWRCSWLLNNVLSFRHFTSSRHQLDECLSWKAHRFIHKIPSGHNFPRLHI